MSRFLVYCLYNALLPLLLLCLAPGAYLKSKRRGGYGDKLGQRFGKYDAETLARLNQRPTGPRFWLHAVSVGEVGVAIKLGRALRRKYPDGDLVLTTTTPTGYQEGANESQRDPAWLILYSPLDLFWIPGHVLRLVQPDCYVLVEAEVWPNLIRACARRRIPACVASARMSPRSAGRYRKFSWLLSPIFSQLCLVAVTDEPDRQNWENLGVALNRIFTTGSIKFDSVGAFPGASELTEHFRTLLTQIGWASSRILLAASTHAGEETLLAEVCRSLQATHPDLKLILVPRHAERAGEIAEELGKSGFTSLKKSALPTADSATSSILIVNTTGELRAWLPLAEIIIIGKSFVAHGGQNPVEGIEAGKPVICGPNMENFLALMNLLKKAHGIVQVNDHKELVNTLQHFLSQPREALQHPRRAELALVPHQGATQRTVDLLAQLQKN